MPTLARSTTGAPSPSSEQGTASTAPPHPGPLLRPGGGVEPSASESFRPSRDILADDARALLGPEPRHAVVERWAATGFVRQVEVIRRHLAPIASADLLVASFGREAFHGSRIGRRPAIATSPVRVAYAIRWIELSAEVRLPEWSAWLEPWAPDH